MSRPSIRDSVQITGNIIKKINRIMPGMNDMFEEEGINTKFVPSSFRIFDILWLNRLYTGFGVKNKNGGVEFYNRQIGDTTITIKKTGVTYFYHKAGEKSRACCLFLDMLDYLAYRTLVGGAYVKLPQKCDCIIVNNIRNFTQAMLDVDEYEKVYCFFPNTEAGKVMSKTLVQRNRVRVLNCDWIYQSYINLRSFNKIMRATVDTY